MTSKPLSPIYRFMHGATFFLHVVFFILVPGTGIFAQEGQDQQDQNDQNDPVSMEELLNKALTVRIQARLFHNVRNIMWQSEVEKLTIPGRTITINMKNNQARLAVHFTPYGKSGGGLILLAHSELWLTEETGTKSLRYFTSMKSIPMEYGELVYFYPLGKMENLNNPDQIHVEMSLSVSSYKLTDKSNTSETPETFP